MAPILVAVAAVPVLFFFMIFLTGSFHPIRWIGKLTVRMLIGVFLLFLLNVVGESFSLHIPINLVTAAVGGILGLPGIAALVLIKLTIDP